MVGIAYYLMILQNQQKNMNTPLETMQAQLFMEIYQTYVTKEIHRDARAQVLYLHQKYQPIISGLRKANSTVYTDFDVLYEAVKKFIPEPSLAERHSVY